MTKKLLLLPITVCFLLLFLASNGQNTVATNPAVTINQAVVQADPTNTQPLSFTVVFDQPVIGFTTGDVVITGTASAGVTTVITGGPTTYNVAIAGIISCGTIIANIPAGVCTNAISELNLESTSTDNTVTYIMGNPGVTINQAATQTDPTSAAPINFTVQFDQVVTGFTTGDVTLSGTAGATIATITGSGSTYNVAVSGITASGTVIATIAAGVCQNGCALPNNASTSTDNKVTISCVPPPVSIVPTVTCGGVVGLYGTPLIATSGPAVPGSVTVSAGGVNRTIPDNTANGINNVIAMTAVPSYATITNISVGLILQHTYPGDMIINLKGPNGQIINLYKYNAGLFTGPVSGNSSWGWSTAWVSANGTTPWSTVIAPYIYNSTTSWKADLLNSAVAGVTIQNPTGFISNALSFSALYTTAASTNGNWTLALCDGGSPGDIGTLYDWAIKIDYTVPGVANTNTYVWSPVAGLFTDAQTNILYNGSSTAIVYAAPTTPTTYTVTATNTATGCTSTATALVNNTPPPPVVTPNPALMCLGDAAIKLKATSVVPATPAVWTPSAGLYLNQAATIPYIPGTAIDSVWARPTPAGTYTYQVTTLAVPPSTLCTSLPGSVVVTVGAPVTIITHPVGRTVCVNSSVSFTVSIAASGPVTYTWQTSTNSGATWINIANGGVYSGVNTSTLTINPATLAINGNLFRIVVNGGGSCPSTISNAALLTVYAQPTVNITANPLTIASGQTTTIYSTVTPSPAGTYTWYYNGGILTGATADTLLVSYGSPGDYQLKVNGCGVGVSNIITIANSFALNLVPYPNPSAGKFQVTYYSGTSNAVQRTMIVYNNNGDKIMTKPFTQISSYQKVDVDVRANGKGIYWVELRDTDGKRLALDRVVVQ